MELTIDKRKKQLNDEYNLGLSKWEMLLWQNMGIQVNDNSRIAEKLRENLKFDLDELYAFADNPKQFEISVEKNDELDKYFIGQVEAYKARGEEHNANYLLYNEAQEKQKLAEMFGTKQYEEYKHIVGVLKAGNYDDSFKYLMLNETLQKTYRMDFSKSKPNLIINDRVKGQSVHGMMNLPVEVLDYIYENIDNYTGFKKLYTDAQVEFNKLVTKDSGINLDGVNTFDKGHWVKFSGKAADPDNFESNVERLKALVSNTPWCTATLASTHLEQGDFYVFVDNDNQPHIAVKMSGEAIDEVRGVQGGKQELEPEYRDVALDFLENNKEIKNGKKWLEKEEWNKRLIAYGEAIENGDIDVIDMEQLFDDFIRNDYKAHFGMNSNLDKLKDYINNNTDLQDGIVGYYSKKNNKNYTTENFCFGNMTPVNANSNIKIVLGSVILSNSGDFDLSGLEVVIGDADFTDSQVTDLSSLTSIGGGAWFIDSQVRDLSSLVSIGGDATFSGSQVTDLSSLTSIGGNASFGYSQVTDLSNLTTIGGSAYFQKTKRRDLSGLTTIGGIANFKGAEIDDMSGLTEVLGKWSIFKDAKIRDMSGLKQLFGRVEFNSAIITDMSGLTTIDGSGFFNEAKIGYLNNLTTIAEDANFSGAKIDNLSSLTAIGGDADFIGAKIGSLSSLTTIGGDADFTNAGIESLDSLTTIGKNAFLFDSNIISMPKLSKVEKVFLNKDQCFDFSNTDVNWIYRFVKPFDEVQDYVSELDPDVYDGIVSFAYEKFFDFLREQNYMTKMTKEEYMSYYNIRLASVAG